jgi:hypothetical protein
VFPHSDNNPASGPEEAVGTRIPLPIRLDFALPIDFRESGATTMNWASMPKTAVDEERYPLPTEDEVWPYLKVAPRPIRLAHS